MKTTMNDICTLWVNHLSRTESFHPILNGLSKPMMVTPTFIIFEFINDIDNHEAWQSHKLISKEIQTLCKK